MWLRVAEEQRWLAGRGNVGRIIGVENQLDVVGWRRHVVDIQTEKGGEIISTLSHAIPHATKSGCG
jgi:hypothetical protein